MKLITKVTMTSVLSSMICLPAMAKPTSSKSPASMYKVDSTLADSTFTYTDSSFDVTRQGYSKTETSSNLEQNLTALHKLSDLPVQVGFNYYKDGDKLVSVTPSIAYSLNDNVSLGLEASSTNVIDKDEKATYQSAVGAIFHNDEIEVGVGYYQEIGAKEKRDSKPQIFGAHVKRKMGDNFSAQLELGDSQNPKSAYVKRNVVDGKLKLAYDINSDLQVKGSLAHTGTAYRSAEHMSVKNISKTSYAVSLDVDLGNNFILSPELEYGYGQGTRTDTEYTRKSLTSELAVTWIR